MEAKRHVFKYGENVDTDVIIPARYLNATTGEELAKHCMEDIDKDFVNKVQKGDIIVARKNFGCGLSREHAPLAIKFDPERSPRPARQIQVPNHMRDSHSGRVSRPSVRIG